MQPFLYGRSLQSQCFVTVGSFAVTRQAIFFVLLTSRHRKKKRLRERQAVYSCYNVSDNRN